MPYPNLKAQTIKIPRRPLKPADQDHLLDVLVACASRGVRNPMPNHADRQAFEHYIANSSEINPRVKAALAKLSQAEREALFR